MDQDITHMLGSVAKEDTIFALASGMQKAAIAIMRISGPASASLLERFCGHLPKARQANLRTLWHDYHQRDWVLDEALVLWFPGPRSYTGEDSFELHLHASSAVIDDVACACVDGGARPAQPGEFTRRAFLNGRMDLIQAEGVADLIASETQSQKQQALRQTDGQLSRYYKKWRHDIKQILAFAEASIDFSDEELPQEMLRENEQRIHALVDDMQVHIDEGAMSRRVREGIVFAIVGAPNVGKSTFLNWICQRDVAITSSVAGTTRDALEVHAQIDGIKTTFVDTAGLRETDNPIEAEGVKRAMFHVKHCDYLISMFSPYSPVIDEMQAGLLVGNKCDVGTIPDEVDGQEVLKVSFKEKIGLDTLYQHLRKITEKLTKASNTRPHMTRARHSAAVKEAVGHLKAALRDDFEEVRSEELRLAMGALSQLVGLVNNEELLDSIFSEFCIGK